MATFVLDPAADLTASVPRTNKQIPRRQYRDKQFKGGEAEWRKKLDTSTTVYIGNLSCYTNECQLHELFSRCGNIERIIMGLDKITKKPCGFCFVEFFDRESAQESINLFNRTHLDGREIQVDIDAGFEEGRQYGRGAHGGQIGDERRREREQGPGSGPGAAGYRGGFQTSANVLTRSITVVACLAVISIFLLVCQPEPVNSSSISISTSTHPFRSRGNLYMNSNYIRKAQLSEHRVQFEANFAKFLVNLMKQAQPTLLKAFMQATLADRQLKELAIDLFFNNTGSADDS